MYKRQEMNNATTVLNKMERQFDGLQSELQKSASESEDFAEAVEEIGDAAEESSGGFTVMKGALSGLVSGGIQAAAGAAEEFVESIVDMAEETEEYRAMPVSYTHLDVYKRQSHLHPGPDRELLHGERLLRPAQPQRHAAPDRLLHSVRLRRKSGAGS